jgi:hypothetical protein
MRQVQGPGCSPRQACWSRPGGEREGEGERAVGVLVTRVGVWPLLLLLLSLQLQSLLLLARLNPSTPQQDGVHSSRASGPSLCTWAHAGRGCPVPLSGEAGRRNAATPPLRSAGIEMESGVPATTAGSREMCMASQRSPSCACLAPRRAGILHEAGMTWTDAFPTPTHPPLWLVRGQALVQDDGTQATGCHCCWLQVTVCDATAQAWIILCVLRLRITRLHPQPPHRPLQATTYLILEIAHPLHLVPATTSAI